MSLRFLRELKEYRELLRAAELEERPAGLLVSGAVEAVKPLLIAQLLLDFEKPRRSLVFLRPEGSPLAGFTDQVRFFLDELLKGSVGRPQKETIQCPHVAALPPLSENPYLEVPHSLEVVSSRMHYFRRLCRRPPDLTVTTLRGILKPIPHKASLAKAFLTLEKGSLMDRDRLLHWLRMSGYTREDLVNTHGEYAWRGGIVDVFSPWEDLPFRIELGADKVVSLRTFDPSSQRSHARRKDIEIPALREFPGSDSFFREWEEVARIRGRSMAWDDLTKKIERLHEGDIFPSFSYLALLAGDRFRLPLDFLESPLYVIDGYPEVSERWNETLEDFGEQAEDLRSQKKFVAAPGAVSYTHLRAHET